MKKKFIFLCILIFTGFILFYPQKAVESATNGLVLWYQNVLPSLLPFAVLSNILIYSNYLQYITRYLHKLTQFFLPASEEGAFVIISGFLFGFPMGSKNCSELLKHGKLKKEEANVLFVITNNISPVFISGFILCQQLQMPSLIAVSYLVLYLPPIIAGAILLRQKAVSGVLSGNAFSHKKPASGSQMNFKIIDAGIMNGFETLTRLGGYIMLFSMLTAMLSILPLSPLIQTVLSGVFEITNGIKQLQQINLCPAARYIMAMAFTALGGLSGIAQTNSMVRDSGLSMRYYCKLKLLLTACTILLAWAVTRFCSPALFS